MSSSLLLQQGSGCLVCLIWMVLAMGVSGPGSEVKEGVLHIQKLQHY